MKGKFGKSGSDHPRWSGGVKPEYYRKVAFDAYGERCQRCAATESLVVHHVDRNRRNSAVGNLEVLCRSCHMKEHHGHRVDWTCPACLSVIQIVPSDAKNRKFCSNQCRMKYSRTHGGTFGELRESLIQKEAS